MITRGVDHIALTVKNIEDATNFFREAFDAKIAYDLHSPEKKPLSGKSLERNLGLSPDGKLVHMRMLSIGNSVSVELFNYDVIAQASVHHTYDIGLQHIAFYVDDIVLAAKKFTKAGGKLYSDINPIFGDIEGTSEKNQYVYGETPWGTVIELVTYPVAINYPKYSEGERFTPDLKLKK